MDCRHYITDLPERKRGQHLQREERGAIQALKRQGLSNRAIARELGCSPTTIGNELRRGTPPRKSSKGRAPGYSAKHGEAVYRSNRLRSRKPHKLLSCGAFVSWVAAQVREHKWSLDACTGYAKRHGLFQCNEMVCTHTLYHEAWAGNLPTGYALPTASLTAPAVLAVWQSSPAYAEHFLFMRVSNLHLPFAFVTKGLTY